tara:strand:- start:491 stop:1321 length:831 start_codon:yes stop_codon:yes gene_type:complete
MKLRHNKKRNTAFIFEALVKEMTKSVIKKNDEKKKQIAVIIKEHFKNNSILGKELKLYQAIVEEQDLGTDEEAQNLLQEAKRQYDKLDREQIFQEQSHVINKINKILSKDVFSNFVPNYKSLATVYQVFNQEMPPKNRLVLEGTLIEDIVRNAKSVANKIPGDALVFKNFVKKFNSEYSGKLFEEQRSLLSKYITSFADNGIDFKIFMNEELGRLKEELSNARKLQELETNADMLQKTERVLEFVESFKERELDEQSIEKILKIQKLVRELQTDGN